MQVLNFVAGSILWTVIFHYSSSTLTWSIVAIAASLGIWTTLFLRRIPPGQELEAVTQGTIESTGMTC